MAHITPDGLTDQLSTVVTSPLQATAILVDTAPAETLTAPGGHPTVNNTPRSATDEPASADLLQQRSLSKEQRLDDIKNQCSLLISELDTNQDPEAIVKKHISQLKKYHELKDIALGLVTMIADQRQLRTTDILEEMKFELEE